MKKVKLYEEFSSDKKSKINEDRLDDTKMFEPSLITDTIDEIKKLLKWKDERYGNQSFDYSEHNFKDGSGQIGVSFGKDGNHKYYAYSWYDKNLTGKATTNDMKPFKFKGKPEVWQDFDNSHLEEFWKKVKGDIKKNEAGSKAALDAEAKGQAEFYGNKADTGRIGYGLSSQPRR